ncbi:MAG: CRISPR-associated protein Cas4 [Alicyclobacillus sp.]|nr:CRISPR-associated protein Cas4 [Alicyclobacillus sp.]
MVWEDDEYLALSGIQHFAFCERQWALIHVEQQWRENVLTTEGQHVHERVDEVQFDETRRDLRVVRSVPIVSHSLGLRGIADMVEFRRVRSATDETMSLDGRQGFWTVTPVEYKRGKPKPDDRDIVQLCAQAMCLEEMLGVSVRRGTFFYAQTRKREYVEFTEMDRARVKALCERMHDFLRAALTPRAVYKSHCKSCSLFEICQPKLSVPKARSASGYVLEHVGGEALSSDC